MKRLIKFGLMVGFAAVLSLAGAEANTIQVQVGANGLKFTPQDVTITVGDTVEWIWADNFHSATSGTPGNPDGLFDSGILNNGATFSFTFTGAGTFPYFCSPHGACCGMIGSVTVTASTDSVDITKAVYDTAGAQLTVTATDTSDSATLTVTVTRTGQVLGTLRNKGGGTYTSKFKNVLTNPQKITVTSNLGGTDTAKVRAR
jgi:plastocyanin